jgi:hypothetical protein
MSRGRRRTDGARHDQRSDDGACNECPGRARTEDKGDRKRRDESDCAVDDCRSAQKRRGPTDAGNRHGGRRDRPSRRDEEAGGQRESEDRAQDEGVHLGVLARGEGQEDGIEVDDPLCNVLEQR